MLANDCKRSAEFKTIVELSVVVSAIFKTAIEKKQNNTLFTNKMKKNILILTILLGYQGIAFAQKKVLYGVYAGANVSKLKPLVWSKNNRPFSQSYRWTPSYNFGAFVIYNLGKSFYAESGTTIISKKSIGSPREFDKY